MILVARLAQMGSRQSLLDLGGGGSWSASATENGQRSWSWKDFLALPQEDVTTDIHCVTSWSKLGTRWRGVFVDTLVEGLPTEHRFAMARSYGGYATNLPLADLLAGEAWVVHEFDAAPLASEHGGPARLRYASLQTTSKP